ncbi:MAG: 2,3-bisphosphoglycerate-independent phosphoglycerate mutase [Candidatus Aenigmarchaeota archaeon]|nr:2,3-bisphosphoglycerate-independent phosphoglycerate mutase [Candidatus Aenigmarchaeota archaeon]
MKPKNRVILIIRDGWGYSEKVKGNAVRNANVPNNDNYERHYPWTTLECSGNAVGLPEGTQGGSEPGHLTMGAGRIVWQPYENINRKIKDGSFFKNKALLKAMENCKRHDSSLHLMGLFSDQGVHGTVDHLYPLLEMAKKHGLNKVWVHAFLDGRDVPEKSAAEYIKEFNEKSNKIGVGSIATIIGRFYAMDRDNNWDRTEKAYFLLTRGLGIEEMDPLKAIKHAYERGERSLEEGRAGDTTDYYVRPIVIVHQHEKPIATIGNHDSVIFWNFRSDRARQITSALTSKKFDHFDRGNGHDITFVCMSEYDKRLALPVAFPQSTVRENLGKVLSEHGLRQLRIAETEKYAHVTYFFNSQVEAPNPGEERIMVDSPKVPSYDRKPEMSAYGITSKVLREIGKKKYDLIVINFANGDLVGHSGKLDAGIKACEAVDECVGRIVNLGLENGYVDIVTADHGNVEIMFYPNGEVCPAHGTNPVPFFIVSPQGVLGNFKLKKGGGLKDVAPTILEIMGLKKPKEMGGESLITR